MTAQLTPTPVFKAFSNNGIPLASGQLFSYQAGTSTPQPTYIDSSQSTPNTNPTVLNARGEANIWLDPTLSYKFTLQDSFGNLIWTVDNIQGISVVIANYLAPILTQNNLAQILYPQTVAETGAGVLPVNYIAPPGYVDRYVQNTAPGVTPMDAGFNAAIAQNLQAGGAPVVVASPALLTSNLSLPVGTDLIFRSPGSITGAVTLTIKGTLVAPCIPVFLGALAVVLANNACAEACPEWWGAVADGAPTGTGTDNTAALTACFTACSGGSLTLGVGIGIVPVKLSSGYYLTGAQILTPAFTMRGTGRKTSGFVARNGTTGIWFTDNGNAAGIILENFAMYANSVNATGMTYALRMGYGGSQHGSEGYFNGLWVRDCACSGGNWHVDLNANVGFYELISVYGPATPASGQNLIRVVGAGNMLSQVVAFGAGANAYSVYLNGYGTMVHGLEIETPGTCSASFAPLSIQENAYVYGCVISLNNGSPTSFDHLIETNVNAYSWAVEGLQLFNAGGLGTVSGGNIKLLSPGTYIGGTLQTSVGNQQGTGSYSSGMANVLSGTATFAASTTVLVPLPAGQTVTNYKVQLSGNAAGFCWVTLKNASNFTINCSASNSNTTDWSVTL